MACLSRWRNRTPFMILKLVIRIISTACEAVEKPINNYEESINSCKRWITIIMNIKEECSHWIGLCSTIQWRASIHPTFVQFYKLKCFKLLVRHSQLGQLATLSLSEWLSDLLVLEHSERFWTLVTCEKYAVSGVKHDMTNKKTMAKTKTMTYTCREKLQRAIFETHTSYNKNCIATKQSDSGQYSQFLRRLFTRFHSFGTCFEKTTWLEHQWLLRRKGGNGVANVLLPL